MRERALEFALCATIEQERADLVSRQLGGAVAAPGRRVLDIVAIETTAAVTERAAITPAAIPTALVTGPLGPGRARPPHEATPDTPEQTLRLVDRGLEIGFLERTYRDDRALIRQVTRYPDWIDRIVGIEVKPDLRSPGALIDQLRTDVALGVLDAVVLATTSYVTAAHLHRLPDPVGVWRVDEDGGITVEREPKPLDPGDHGVELRDRTPGRTDVEIVSPADKHAARIQIAERAYAKGWRHFPVPDCANVTLDSTPTTIPYCVALERPVDPETACGPDCQAHEPAPAPSFDPDADRARETPWRPDPPGRRRRQASLDRFD